MLCRLSLSMSSLYYRLNYNISLIKMKKQWDFVINVSLTLSFIDKEVASVIFVILNFSGCKNWNVKNGFWNANNRSNDEVEIFVML